MTAQRHIATTTPSKKSNRGSERLRDTKVPQAAPPGSDARLAIDDVHLGLASLNAAQELGRSLGWIGYPNGESAMLARDIEPRKQEWVWCFADALMAASEGAMEHLDALQRGYRRWESNRLQDPVEAARRELARFAF